MFVCSIFVSREINPVLEGGMDPSVGDERVEVIMVGELGAEPEAVCRLREERELIMLIAFLSAVRKSSTIGIVCEGVYLRSESSI